MNKSREELGLGSYHDSLSADKCRELIPVHVYICVLMVSGLFGNILTCLFYSKKQVTTPTSRLIVVLACIDMTVCLLMPKNIIVMCRAFKGYISELCSASVLFDYVAAISSILILISIASFRVRALARPTSWQFTVRHANIAVMLSLVGSVTLSLPSAFTHKTQKITVIIDSTSVTGYICKITPESRSKIFNMFLFVIMGAAFVVLVVLYSFIGTKIFKYYKAKKTLSQKPKSSNKPDATCSTGDIFTNDSSGVTHVNTRTRSDTIVPCYDLPEVNQRNSNSTQYSLKHTIEKSSSSIDGRQNAENHLSVVQPRATKVNINVTTARHSTISAVFVRQVVMLFVITVIFMISFLPYLVTARLLSQNGTTDVFVNKYQIGLRSFLINSASNPFVYGLFSSEFRNFVKNLFFPIFNRCLK